MINYRNPLVLIWLAISAIQSISAQAQSCETCMSPENIISHWTGDGDANDAISTNDGTPLDGIMYDAGKVGEGFSFDGDSIVTAGNDISLNFNAQDSFTLAAWFKTSSDNGYIAQKVPTLGAFYYIGVFGDKARFKLYTSIHSISIVESPEDVNDGEWHHIAAVRDAANAQVHLYIDGLLVNSAVDQIATSLWNSGDFQIGGRSNHVAYRFPFDGAIDELILFRCPLSSTEVEMVYRLTE